MEASCRQVPRWLTVKNHSILNSECIRFSFRPRDNQSLRYGDLVHQEGSAEVAVKAHNSWATVGYRSSRMQGRPRGERGHVAHVWRIRPRSWSFVLVPRLADLSH